MASALSQPPWLWGDLPPSDGPSPQSSALPLLHSAPQSTEVLQVKYSPCLGVPPVPMPLTPVVPL